MRALRIVVRPPGPRAVLDTNLFVGAYWSPGSASARILDACEGGRVQLIHSPAIRRELFLILRNAHTSRAHRERVAGLLEEGEEIHPAHAPRRVPDDPDDDKFLACAIEGRAACVVTSDVHLLRLVEVDGVRILKPGAFVIEYLAGP